MLCICYRLTVKWSFSWLYVKRTAVCFVSITSNGELEQRKMNQKKLVIIMPPPPMGGGIIITRDSDTTFKVKRSKVNLQGAGHIVAAPPAQLVIKLSYVSSGDPWFGRKSSGNYAQQFSGLYMRSASADNAQIMLAVYAAPVSLFEKFCFHYEFLTAHCKRCLNPCRLSLNSLVTRR